ncbi:hypothetical protein GW17_00058885, partial [Ensete ventricosum]
RRYTLSGDKLFYIVRQYLTLRATSYFNSASVPNRRYTLSCLTLTLRATSYLNSASTTILIVRQLRRLLAWVRDVGFTAREQGAPHSVAIVDDLRLEYFPSQLSLALLLFAP